MAESDGTTILMCWVGGMIDRGTRAELSIMAMDSTPGHIRSVLIDQGIARVQRECPGVQDVRLLDGWHEVEFAPVEADDA